MEDTPLTRIRAFDKEVKIPKRPKRYRSPAVLEPRNEAIRRTHELIQELAKDWISLNEYEKNPYYDIDPKLLDYSIESLRAIDAYNQKYGFSNFFKTDYIRNFIVPSLAAYLIRTLEQNQPGGWFWEYRTGLMQHEMKAGAGAKIFQPFRFVEDVVYSGFRLEEYFKVFRYFTSVSATQFLYLAPEDPEKVPDKQVAERALKLLREEFPSPCEVDDTLHGRVGLGGGDGLLFVSAEELLTHVTCPGCKKERSFGAQWHNRIHDALDRNEPLKDVKMEAPCCGKEIRLQGLRFRSHSCFASYVIRISRRGRFEDFDTLRPPLQISPRLLKAVERALGFQLQQVQGLYL